MAPKGWNVATCGFLAAYLGPTSCFVFHTEQELGKGYADMVLTPLATRRYAHGYVAKLKYLKRERGTEATSSAAVKSAKDQLMWLSGRRAVSATAPSVRFSGVAMVSRRRMAGREFRFGTDSTYMGTLCGDALPLKALIQHDNMASEPLTARANF